jgi:hypothetical protein
MWGKLGKNYDYIRVADGGKNILTLKRPTFSHENALGGDPIISFYIFRQHYLLHF